MTHRLLILAVFLAGTLRSAAQTNAPQSDTWVCTDDLGRVVASSDEGVSRTDMDEEAVIGMFYFLSQGQHGAETKDITRIVAANPETPAFGPWNAPHWGGKPALGYYTSGTPYIVARHMQMLVDAGIDFYFFDVTNAYTYDDQFKVVMKEIDRRTQLGLRSPKLVFTTHAGSANVVTHLYNNYYAKTANDKYWFMWEGKPLILVESGTENSLSEKVRNHFTFRYCWAWETGNKKWAWLANYPQGSGTSGGRLEQMSVSAAQHATSKIGKSYHNGKQPQVDKYGLCKETPQGLYFQEQWTQAHRVHPPVLMITQWNEWIAQRFQITDESQFSQVRPGATPRIGESYFVDVYNQEFSRDIEPSSEPLIRDNYYLQMVSNIRQYRGVHQIPVPTVARSIAIDGSFAQWEDITPDFRDEPGDVYYTSTTAQTSTERLRASNDIVSAKVTKDRDSLYFYVATRYNIRALTDSSEKVRWMTLLINADLDYANGWYGYDYMVSDENRQLKFFRYTDGAWQAVSDVRWRMEGKEMMVALNREQTGMEEDADFDFKWIDNILKSTTDVLDFVAKGEAAPNGRFNYRYKGSRLLSRPFQGYFYIENAYNAWQTRKTMALLDTPSGRLDWNAEESADQRFIWHVVPNADGTYSIQNTASRRYIGPLAQPALNGDGCGSTVQMSDTPAPLHIEMGTNGALLIHHGGTCTAHAKACQPFHANGHNTDKAGTAPAPDGVTAWLDDNLDLSTWRLADASAVSYHNQLQAMLSLYTRDSYPAGGTFGSYRPAYAEAYLQAYDAAREACDAATDIFDPALDEAMQRLRQAIEDVEAKGYIPLTDGYYYITSAATWDDFTTKGFHAATNYINVADLIKGRIESQGGKAICIFQVTYNDDEAHSYTIYSPSMNKYAGKWKSGQVPMVEERNKAPICIEHTGQGTVNMHYAGATDERTFYPATYSKASYTTTGANFRIKGAPWQEGGLYEWCLTPTLPAEENPYVLNDTLCQLDTLLDSHPLRRYEGGGYDALLLANFITARSEAQQADDAQQGHYTAVLRALQSAIDALEGRTGVGSLTPDPSPRRGEKAYDLQGRPATPAMRGIIVRKGKKVWKK